MSERVTCICGATFPAKVGGDGPYTGDPTWEAQALAEHDRAMAAYQLLKDALSDDEAPTLLDRLMVAERDLERLRDEYADAMSRLFDTNQALATGLDRGALRGRGGQPT